MESNPTNNQDPPPSDSESDESTPQSLWYTYRYLIILSLIFIGMSVYYAVTYFPELSTGRAVFGGLCFGVFCAMCAATYSQI